MHPSKRNGIPWREVIGVAVKLAPLITNLMESMGVIQGGQAGWLPDLETLFRDQAAGFAGQATIDALVIAGKGAARVSYQRQRQREVVWCCLIIYN